MKTLQKNKNGMDFLWYLWCGENSPIFCKDAMKTFERYYIEDEETWKEHKIRFIHSARMKMFVKKYLETFGINEEIGHIICGHIPVKYKKGENPIKASGKLLMIDGGLSKSHIRNYRNCWIYSNFQLIWLSISSS